MRVAVLLLASLAATACSSYSDALGYRARRAVLDRNVDAFPALMAEASQTEPISPKDNPKKTVLTHFLDLASDSRFFPYIEDWRSKGWVDEDMVCSIHRAHYREAHATDPEGAQKSIDICVDTARAAARDPEKNWQVADCLEEATFLTETSTAALVQFLKRVADPTEPLRFRAALLEGMARIPVSGPARRQENDSKLTRAEAVAQAEEQLRTVQKRFEWIVAAARPFTDLPLLASATSIGAMEIEESSIALGRTFVGTYSISENPDDNDLAWAWVRVMKTKKKIPSLQSLGIWNKEKEPKDDAYWYVCARPGAPPPKGSPAAAIAPVTMIEAITIRSSTKTDQLDTLRSARCPDYPNLIGPFPLEAIAKGTAALRFAPANTSGASVILRRRILL